VNISAQGYEDKRISLQPLALAARCNVVRLKHLVILSFNNLTPTIKNLQKQK
jgi:hypothetical protein